MSFTALPDLINIALATGNNPRAKMLWQELWEQDHEAALEAHQDAQDEYGVTLNG